MTITTVGFRTDVGRQRSLNEDAVLAGQQIWAVADGMGGHAAGDVAAALAIGRLKALDQQPDLRPGDLNAAIAQANADVLDYGQRHPDAWGLGTTVTGLARCLVAGSAHWVVFNVGDSRVYRIWDGQLSRATVDHSETEELVLRGLISPEQARTHQLRNIITRSVGTVPAPLVDLRVLPQSPGERWLICSDGLNSELTDIQIARVVTNIADPVRAADALVEAVLRTRARDNVSVIVVDVHGDDQIDETTNPRGHLCRS